MMIFALGLTLVITTNQIFTELTEDFQESLANTEGSRLIAKMRIQIQDKMQIERDLNHTITLDVDLPLLIGNRYQYSIIAKTRGANMSLSCVTSTGLTNETIIFNVPVHFQVSEINGIFESKYPVHRIKLDFNYLNQVNIFLMNENM